MTGTTDPDVDHLPRVRIGISRESIAAGRALVAMPCVNPSMGATLEVAGLPGEAFMITLEDPMGEFVWGVILEGADMPVDV